MLYIDIVLPDIVGVDLLCQLKAIDRGPEMVMITGQPTPELKLRSRAAGAFEFVEKPIYQESFMEIMNRAFQRRQRRRRHHKEPERIRVA